MQSKVSMVIPCYNKDRYIAAMFDSVLAQVWDHIELVIVNDGSTDGTRDIITSYEAKFKKRGYDVIIVDQKNMGVACAVQEGLKMVTGKYVVLPDCDDVLDREYVSAMAEILEANEEPDFVVCDSKRLQWDFCRNFSNAPATEPLSVIDHDRDLLAEDLLHYIIMGAAWAILFRASLIEELGMTQFRITFRKSSQEPLIWVPITARRCKGIYLKKALYNHLANNDSMTRRLTTLDDVVSITRDTLDLTKELVKLCAPSNENAYYSALAEIGVNYTNYLYLLKSSPKNIDEYLTHVADAFVCIVNQNSLLPIKLTHDAVRKAGYYVTYEAVCDFILKTELCGIGVTPLQLEERKGRLIAYGFGPLGKQNIDELLTNGMIPDVIWDRRFDDGDRFKGVPFEKPDFNTLTKRDVVVSFLNGYREVQQKLIDSPATVFHYRQVIRALAQKKYPELYKR